MSAESLRTDLIAELRRKGALTQAAVAEAVRRVPRHLFVPASPIAEAYQDRAIMTKTVDGVAVSSLSQPAIITIMLEQLGVQPGMNVLEIGAGTGYNAALLAHIAGPNGQVTTIDIDDDIVQAARAHLGAAGTAGVTVVLGDGGNGMASRAPYDRVILTVAAWDISPAWLEQLAPGGLIVLPLWLGLRQFSVAFEKVCEHLESRSIRGCGFMPLRGAFAGPALFAGAGGVQFSGPAVSRFDPATVAASLDLPPRHYMFPDKLAMTDFIDFMALSDQIACGAYKVNAEGPAARAYVLVADNGRSVVWMPFGAECDWELGTGVDVYGSDAAWQQLTAQFERFEAAHRPSLARGHVRAWLAGSGTGESGTLTIHKTWMTYAVKFG
jgi:protein-L-isoaspartate(D-aspartate) O-methyltransferase